MAIGERKTANIGTGYVKDPMYGLTCEFLQTANDIISESSVDVFGDPRIALMRNSSMEALKNFFIENSIDKAEFENDPEAYEAHLENAAELFENDREAVLEYASMGNYNPTIGLSFPMHKNLLMNCVYNQFLPKDVTKSPKFTFTMEDRFLVTPEGEEIDMFKEQHRISEEMNKTVPFVPVELKLPEVGETDIITAIGGSPGIDNLSIASYISHVKVEVNGPGEGTVEEHGSHYIWKPVHMEFKPGYTEFDRTLNASVNLANVENIKGDVLDDDISGSLTKNKFRIGSLTGAVKAVRLMARIDTSNGLTKTCSVAWRSRTVLEEVPDATPISVAISPEEVKDIAALYNENQLTKIMSMINDVMANHKDDDIKTKLDQSFLTMDPESKLTGKFDFKPREGYALDDVEWRHKVFFDVLDSFVTELYEVLNDPNVSVAILGRPDIIRKITPTEYSYQSPSSIGPVELNFNKTVVTSDKRVYNFMSSQKLKKDNTLTITLHPRNTNRLIYKIFDYQMYVSNEIRNSTLYTLPAVTAFERWKFVQYQPVQARIEILNPTMLLKRD